MQKMCYLIGFTLSEIECGLITELSYSLYGTI